MTPNPIAARIKQTRLLRKLTQVQLADEIGASQSTIGNIEAGLRKRPRELVAIAKALGVTPEWLETGEEPQAKPDIPARNPPSVRAMVEELVALALPLRPTLRRNLANLLVDLVEHADDTALVEQVVADLARFFPPK